MGSEHRKTNLHFIKMAGTFSIFAGIITIASVFYIFVVLGNLGLDIKMLRNTEELLTWIDSNAFAYSILWVHYALMAVLMLPVPLATSQIFREHSHRSSSMATSSYLVGLSGFYLIILSSIVFFTVAPIMAAAFNKDVNNSIFLYKIFDSIGINIRLFGEFLIGLWIVGIGIHQVRKNKIDSFGWYCIVFAAFCTIVTICKAFNIFDWEPLLGMVIAFTFLWLGWIMRQKAK